MTFSLDKIKTKDNIWILTLKGRFISESDAYMLINQLDELIDNEEINFIFNLEGLEYINSSGLNALIHSLTVSRNNGGEVVLCKMPQKIKDLLIATKLNSIFTVKESEALAKAHLRELNNVLETNN